MSLKRIALSSAFSLPLISKGLVASCNVALERLLSGVGSNMTCKNKMRW